MAIIKDLSSPIVCLQQWWMARAVRHLHSWYVPSLICFPRLQNISTPSRVRSVISTTNDTRRIFIPSPYLFAFSSSAKLPSTEFPSLIHYRIKVPEGLLSQEPYRAIEESLHGPALFIFILPLSLFPLLTLSAIKWINEKNNFQVPLFSNAKSFSIVKVHYLSALVPLDISPNFDWGKGWT